MNYWFTFVVLEREGGGVNVKYQIFLLVTQKHFVGCWILTWPSNHVGPRIMYFYKTCNNPPQPISITSCYIFLVLEHFFSPGDITRNIDINSYRV